MGPIVKEVAANYADKSVQFIVFDFTSDETKAAAAKAAKELGVEGTFAAHEGQTGFALVYDTRTQQIVKKMSAKDDASAWGEVIDQALGG